MKFILIILVKENANPGEGDDLEAMEPAMSVQKQNLLTKFAREGIVNIVQRLESSENAAVSLAQKKFPHFSGPAFTFTEYIKQLILVAEACPDIAQRLWGCIVENILKIDVCLKASEICLFKIEHFTLGLYFQINH